MRNKCYLLTIASLLGVVVVLCSSPRAMGAETSESMNAVNANTITQRTKKRRLSRQQQLKNKQLAKQQAQEQAQQEEDRIKQATQKPKAPLDPYALNLARTGFTETLEVTRALKEKEESDTKLIKDVKSLRPAQATTDLDNTVIVNLDKTDFTNFLSWIESIFKIKLLSGDSVTPPVAGKVSGNLISYKTNKAMTKQQVWDLFLNFLDIIGLTLIPTHYTNNYPDSFTVMPNDTANQAPLPSFVGIDWQTLPDNDTKIRYVYFVENGPVTNLFNIIQDLKSKSAIIQPFNALNALIFSDKSANIKSLMAIVAELDSVSMPEAMSVLKLKHANAEDVVTLYQNLVSTEDKNANIATRLFGAKKQPTAVYFPEDTQIIAEPRANALIILGNREGISKVENFILEYVDTELQQPYSPLYVYELQYANAENIAALLTKVTNFAPNTPAATYGGVRDSDKYIRPMTFIAEPTGNKLLIKAEKDDYLKVKEIIKILDVKQPQIAIEALIVSVSINQIKALGTQIRNKRSDTFGTDNLAFQTSGIGGGTASLSGIVTTADGGLMGNLVSLATGFNAGTTLISFGSNLVGGVWALFQALETYAYTNIVSHPFLTTTNKYTAQVSIGQTRRVATGTVTGAGPTQNTLGDVSANLTVAITPQINSNGIINMAIEISIDEFTNPDALSPTKNTRVIKTNANLANNEILAIGGILRDNISEIENGVPILQRIPLLGWFFKNKTKTKFKDNLIVFISPQIVEPLVGGGIGSYSKEKAILAQDDMCAMRHCAEQRDPIHRWFFRDRPCENTERIDDFIENNSECTIVKGYNCRTGQEYPEESVGTDKAIMGCPVPLCPDANGCCPEPLCPPPPCNRCPIMCDNTEIAKIVSEAPTIQTASAQSAPEIKKASHFKRKQSVSDFLIQDNQEVIG